MCQGVAFLHDKVQLCTGWVTTTELILPAQEARGPGLAEYTGA